MRYFLIVIAAFAALFSLLFFVFGFAGGTDLQLIAGGVFATVFVVALGCSGIMARLEDLLKRSK